MATDPVLHSVRDYYWGCIYCEGPKEYEGEYGHLTGDGPFFAVEDQITVEVVNSRLVEQEDADVELNVYVRAAALPSSDHASVIVLRSGTLSIGDADRFDEVGLSPGRWLMQVDLAPRGPDGARWVNIHLSPEDAP
ncbi:hypothetical protein ABZ234_01340 [Nocardiopsis sp. NPDC006198]|uniref:hypothetical protein n=1 Tax=Nocardiopsis sp. NPDC006198 TaxID=3154472 RepID=UPI0033BA171A